MKRTFLISTLLLCAFYLSAQSSPDQSSSHSSDQTGAGHQIKVRGCVAGSEGNYTVTDKSGKTYQLLGDTSKLADQVGHTVEVSGMVSSQSTGSSAATSPAAGAETQHRLDVSSVKNISSTCSTSH